MKDTYKGALSKAKIAIVSYTFKINGKPSYIAGPPQDLYKYLKRKCSEVVFIEQPMSYSENLAPTAVICQRGEETNRYSFPMRLFPFKKARAHIQSTPFVYFIFKIRDVISTLYFFIKLRRKFDVYVGVEAVNGLLGIFFRSLGLVKTVAYDIIDYSPRRFDNKFLNFLYHKLDKICVYYADYAWNQTDRVTQTRFRMGINVKKACPQLVKPSGVDSEKVRKLPLDKIDKFGLIYVGALFKTDGMEMVIEAMPDLCRRFKALHLTVVGHGDQRSLLEERVRALGLADRINFLGTVAKQEKIEELLLKNSIGLAPYLADTNSLKFYNDPSKPKLYLSCGLAVVITRVPMVAQKIESAGAGVAINYDREEFQAAVIKLLESDEVISRFRENALNLALEYRWENIFDDLFKQMRFEIS